MDFFDLKDETSTTILKNKVCDLEKRVRRLEELMCGYPEPNYKPPQGEAHKLPENWMYISDFADTFAFMSDTFLRNQIKNHAEFFKNDIMAIGNMHYINPIKVIEFMERKMTPSAKVNKQYQHWKNLSSDLKKLVDEVKLKIEKENFI